MKMSALITTALLAAVTAPAMAATVSEAPKVKATYDAKRDKYCVSQEITGQRIPVQDCRTKAEWAAEGASFSEGKKAQNMKLAQR